MPSTPPAQPQLCEVMRLDGAPGLRATPRISLCCPVCDAPVRIWLRRSLPILAKLFAWCPTCRSPFTVTIAASAAPVRMSAPPPPGVKINTGRVPRLDLLTPGRETRQRFRRGPDRNPRDAGHALLNRERDGTLCAR